MSIIAEKKRLFKELNIPWSNQIEKEYKAYKKENGEAKAEIYLDNLCQDYISYALDHYAAVIHESLKANHPKAETLDDYVIQKEIGKYAMAELIKANLIECCGSYKGAKLYAI